MVLHSPLPICSRWRSHQSSTRREAQWTSMLPLTPTTTPTSSPTTTPATPTSNTTTASRSSATVWATLSSGTPRSPAPLPPVPAPRGRTSRWPPSAMSWPREAAGRVRPRSYPTFQSRSLPWCCPRTTTPAWRGSRQLAVLVPTWVPASLLGCLDCAQWSVLIGDGQWAASLSSGKEKKEGCSVFLQVNSLW